MGGYCSSRIVLYVDGFGVPVKIRRYRKLLLLVNHLPKAGKTANLGVRVLVNGCPCSQDSSRIDYRCTRQVLGMDFDDFITVPS